MRGVASVDEYIDGAGQFREELRTLRKLLNATDLEETVKWGAPCYTIDGKNVVGIAAFKSYVGLWFHQGALLEDPDGVLINASEGKTKALRQWRFTSAKEIKPKLIKAYVNEAIGLARAGKEIKADRNKPVEIPAELKSTMAEDAALKKAFAALTPGKQREYADHISEAKREATRQSRLEKIIPMIKAGAGLHDKYRNC